MSISAIYYQIYTAKFGKNPFILTDSGYIKNTPTYLYLDDLNLIDDLGHILDFFRSIEEESEKFMIKLPCDASSYNYAITFCGGCGKYTNEPMISNKCNKCYEYYKCEYLTENQLVFNKPVMFSFNFYEWIPIDDFLENRNPASHLYLRRMSTFMNDTGRIYLGLIHTEVPRDLSMNDTLKLDALCHVFGVYKVSPCVDEKIKVLLGSYCKFWPKRVLNSVIIA